jgi:hypothetical protein
MVNIITGIYLAVGLNAGLLVIICTLLVIGLIRKN